MSDVPKTSYFVEPTRQVACDQFGVCRASETQPTTEGGRVVISVCSTFCPKYNAARSGDE